MEPASAVAGIIGLAALVLETTLKIRELCHGYSSAEGDVSRVLDSLQSLQNLLEETKRIANSPPVVQSTTALTRTRMETLLKNCDRDLKSWIYRIDNTFPHGNSKIRQRWKKIIVAVDKPKLVDLVSKVSVYTSQIDGMLGIMRGDLGVSTNATVVAMLWSAGKFNFKLEKHLEAIHNGVQSLQVSQDSFQTGTFTRLDSIEVGVQELLYRSVQNVPKMVMAEAERGHLLIPYVRNGNFVGRESIMKDVESKFELPTSNNRVAMYGLGGVGKSQVAIELAYRAQDATPTLSCFWVSAVSRTTFTQSYRQIATSLGVPGTETPNNDVLDLVKSWLQREKTVSWLMIIDNVDDLRALKGETADTDGFNLLQCLPQCAHGKLLFTTRSKTAALRLTGGGVIVQIPAMEADEARRLLQVRLDDDEVLKQDCLDLVTALEYLPLPISHAASYIREMGIAPSRYLRMFNDDKKITKLLKHTYEDLARDGGQTNTVLTTWRISFEQIGRDSPDSADLLKIMGSLHWQDIPQYLLQQDKLEDEDDFDDTVAPLIAFSLVQKSVKSKAFSMHRLIHIAIRSWTQTLEWERKAQKLVIEVFPIVELNEVSTENNTRSRQLLPHAQKVLDMLGLPDAFSLMSVQLKFRIAAYLVISMQLKPALDLFTSLVAPLKEFSKNGITVGFSEADLEDRITRIYFKQGLEIVATERAKKTLERRTASLPADHPDIISAKDLFALALISESKFKEAEDQLKATYSLVVHRYGKTNVMRIALLFSLAAAYTGQMRHQKAADTYKEILDALVPVYGERNDCVIRCLGAMGDSLRCLYALKESGVLIRKALAISEEILGSDHPLTLSMAQRLAFQLQAEEDKPAAFAMFERVWKGHQRAYGAESYTALGSLGNMAVAHESSIEGEILLKMAIELSKKTPGILATTRWLENSLAEVYVKRLPDQISMSEAWCRALLENRKKELATPREIYQAEYYLTTFVYMQARLDEAEALCRATLEQQSKILWPYHDEIWRSKDLLCFIVREKKNWNEVEVVVHQQIKFLEETRGANNCYTLDKKSYLGSVIGQYIIQKDTAATRLRAEEGCTIMTDAYENLVKYYGKSHFHTLETTIRLAKHHSTVKHYDIAKTLFEEAIETCRIKFGDEGQKTLEYEARLAFVLKRSGQTVAANKILERVYPAQVRLWPDNSFETAMFWALTIYELPGRALEGYNFMKTEALGRYKAKFGENRSQDYQNIVNLLRDITFDEQAAWNITDVDRNGEFGEFESFYSFPRPMISKPPMQPLRRAKSWHLETAVLREYPEQIWAEEQQQIFRDLRGEEITEVVEDGSWSCTRCQDNIPYTSSFWRCFEKSCADGRYIICESCHMLGLSCLDFRHPRRRTKAHVDCNICEKEIWDEYVWTCESCATRGFIVCDGCHINGKTRSCPVPEHRLYKKLQPCYRLIFSGDGYHYCNECENEINIHENHWHCNICDEGDYDICPECRNKGVVCKDQSHVLLKQNRWGNAVQEEPVPTKLEVADAGK